MCVKMIFKNREISSLSSEKTKAVIANIWKTAKAAKSSCLANAHSSKDQSKKSQVFINVVGDQLGYQSSYIIGAVPENRIGGKKSAQEIGGKERALAFDLEIDL